MVLYAMYIGNIFNMEFFKKFYIGQCNIIEYLIRLILADPIDCMLMMYLYKNYRINLFGGKDSITLTRCALQWGIYSIIKSYVRCCIKSIISEEK